MTSQNLQFFDVPEVAREAITLAFEEERDPRCLN